MSNRPMRRGGQGPQREEFRRKLFAEQGGLCYLCGKPMTLERRVGSKIPSLFATFDHVIKHAEGGTCHRSNLKLAHASCNSGRDKLYPNEAINVNHTSGVTLGDYWESNRNR